MLMAIFGEAHPMLALLSIMIGAGILGGVINVLRIHEDGKAPPSIWWREILTASAAALATPLFLNMGSCQLVTEFLGTAAAKADHSKGFIFGGFCIVAALASRNFLDVLTNRLLRETQEAKERAANAKQDVEELIAATSEPGAVEEILPASAVEDTVRSAAELPGAPKLDAPNVSVLKTLQQNLGKYTFRSLRGIAKGAELSEEATLHSLERLMQLGLVIRRQARGPHAWYLSERGKLLSLAEIDALQAPASGCVATELSGMS